MSDTPPVDWSDVEVGTRLCKGLLEEEIAQEVTLPAEYLRKREDGADGEEVGP